MISYRDGETGDAASIAALFEQSFVATFAHLYRREDLASFLATMTADRFREQLADPRFQFRLAEDGERLAGYLKLGPPSLPVDAPPDTIELCQLYVLAPWHGAGVAAALMDWALGQAKAQQAKHIQLSVYINNHRARRFYERYGFTDAGRYDFMVGNHADEDIVLRHVVMDAAP